MKWEEGQRIVYENGFIIVKGISCVWKIFIIEINVGLGVIFIFNFDGSVNLMSGVIELGMGIKIVFV